MAKSGAMNKERNIGLYKIFNYLIKPYKFSVTAAKVMELIVSYEQKGMEKGIEKGIEKGLEKGMEKAKLDVAKRMLAKGYDADTIHELTGLPLEKIEQLKK